MKSYERFERFGTPIHNGQDYLKNHIFKRYPVVHSMDEVAKWENSDVEYVWVVDPNIKVYNSFPWYFRPQADQPVCIHAFPYVFKQSKSVKDWDRVKLVPVTSGEYEIKKHSYICGEYDPYKGQERFNIFYIGSDKTSLKNLDERFDNVQVVNTIIEAKEKSYTDMFWVVFDDTIIKPTFKFSYKPDDWSLDFIHVFGNGDIDQLDGVALFPKNINVTDREVNHRFYANKKEIRIVASTPRKFDSFKINNFDDYEAALSASTTEMFWGIPGDVVVDSNFNFDYYISHHSSERKSNHVWLNGNKYNGLVLFSKHAKVTEEELLNRQISNRIEHNVVASLPKRFDIFEVTSYEEYLTALNDSTTHMFWAVPDDVVVNDDFLWDKYFDDKDELDLSTNHVFLNHKYYDGLVLFSKTAKVSEKEFAHRFYVNKKEHDYIASYPKLYDRFTVDSYNDYINARKNSKTEMFWAVPSDVAVSDHFKFDMYFSHHNRYDREITHVFLNNESYDGIVLHSKNVELSEKEVEHRFYIKNKEWDIVASKPKQFPIFEVNTYEDYLKAKDKCKLEMFWMTNNKIVVKPEFDWNFYITHHNQYERKINHVWKNGEYYDGVSLTSKHIELTPREVSYKFFAIKKEYDEVASTAKPYDIVFISNGEQNADENYKLLKQRYPHAKRVDRVKGIHQAHIAAAKLCTTEMFWVVDGDAQLLDDFDLDYQIAEYDLDGKQTVYVWRSFNPVNSLVYGYGGVKLLPTQLTKDVDVNSTDMTTSISNKFKGINRMSNTTAFNTDAFSAWRSGFRECVKLASRTINRQVDEETEFRLNAWCTRGEDKPFGNYTIAGAILGREYGERNKGRPEKLKMINDFNWLQEQFNRSSYPLDE